MIKNRAGKGEKDGDYCSRKQKGSSRWIKTDRVIYVRERETPEYVTVSLNEEFVPSDKVAETVLKDGDNVEFLYFMGGGSYGINR